MRIPRSARPGSASSSSRGCQTQNMAGIDCVGIAEPGLDLGDRQLAWPRGKRRSRRGRRRGRYSTASSPSAAARIVGSDRAHGRGRTRATWSRRNSQRDGTVGTPSLRAARVNATSGAAIDWVKSCAAMPIARSGPAISNSRRICRDIHGSWVGGPGQVPSFSPRGRLDRPAATAPRPGPRSPAAGGGQAGRRRRRRRAPRTAPRVVAR